MCSGGRKRVRVRRGESYMLAMIKMMMTTSAHSAHRMGIPKPGRTVDSTIMRVVSVLPG